jgi:hypothetical protein
MSDMGWHSLGRTALQSRPDQQGRLWRAVLPLARRTYRAGASATGATVAGAFFGGG